MAGTLREKAIALIHIAQAHESKGNLTEALENFQQAIDILLNSQKIERSETAKKAVSTQIMQYLDYAEMLKEKINARKPVAENAIGSDKSGSGTAGTEEETAFRRRIMESAITVNPNVHWSDVVGLEAVKAALTEAVIYPLEMSQLFIDRLRPWNGILLFGPPGTGKTLLAKAIATEASVKLFLQISVSKLMGKYVGESERMVLMLFTVARENRPCIIFCDEVDALCSQRSDGEHDTSLKVKNVFLEEMSGNNDGIFILAATNRPWSLDDAFLRRFQKKIYIPLPCLNARAEMVRTKIASVPNSLSSEDIESIADRCESFTGSDMQTLVETARGRAVSFLRNATFFRCVPYPTNYPRKIIEREAALAYEPTVLDDLNMMIEPCSPGADNAVEMSLADVSARKWLSRVHLPPVSNSDFVYALTIVKPSPMSRPLSEYENYTSSYGERGDQ
jgi:vacuolar protein-sorting-associated protein 4